MLRLRRLLPTRLASSPPQRYGVGAKSRSALKWLNGDWVFYVSFCSKTTCRSRFES